MTTIEHDPSRPPGSDPPDAPSGRPRSLRPLLSRLHFYAGVLVAPFLLVAAASGFLYAATPQIEQLVYADELQAATSGPPISLDDQIAAARAVEPDLPIAAVRPAPEDGDTTRVLFDMGQSAESRHLAVFVDPASGETQGELTVYGTSGSLPLRTWVDELHRSLHLGSVGRVYSELAASWLWVIALAGVALWWTSPRRKERAGERARARLLPTRSGSPRRRTLSWHGAVGTWVVLGFLMLSATGLTWSQFAGANVTELRTALNWSTPAVTADLESDVPVDEHAGHAGHDMSDMDGMEGMEMPPEDSPGVGYQTAWDAARTEGLTADAEITPPAGATGTYVVTEIHRAWPTQVDAAAVDPASGEVVDVVRFDDYPFMAKLARWGIDLHMGTLFGVWNQLGLMLLAGALVTMIVWGYRMWWLRRPTGSRRPGTPPLREAWRAASPLQLTLFAAGTLVIAWFMPVLGVSLLLFLALDQILGANQRARAGAAERARERASRPEDG
ncbi:PepSY-associated TM helix domain-containing protein [Nocardioides insulae]|uniref:PepSY-associated TM helix domain-containing protein n=1 Tax=Nocardioides insulae TaxID=394734 RepID=UPI0006852834|nr:PepSY domain-containing protein [Nocardioides insulae]